MSVPKSPENLEDRGKIQIVPFNIRYFPTAMALALSH